MAAGLSPSQGSAASPVAKKWTWLQNAARIEVGASVVTIDTTAVPGSSAVTPAMGSTVKRTCLPLPGVGEAYADGPTLERLIEIAGRHGVRPVVD